MSGQPTRSATDGASQVLARRTAPAVHALAPRLPQRVLQSGRAPAQLSLFLQPGLPRR